MSRPAAGWTEALPTDRLIAELALWSADLINLGSDIARAESHADLLHIDVSDGHFSPSLLFFPDLVARIRSVTACPIHVHLMVTESALIPQINQFAEAGADVISIHAENTMVADGALGRIRELGLIPGIVLKADTPVAKIVRHLPRVGFVTLMGTTAGLKGEPLSPHAALRLTEARTYIKAARVDHRIVLLADGGIDEASIKPLRKAGADAMVVGSLAFDAPDLGERLAWIKGH
ncbi:ribulose-phosphate 3-epimerase [Oryzibacter oryziterrae]|uniref:ribulose-phosphate 3-epimerase n=1 Tax=Oryzibacter oryziterrae TaxID=2766474 RepID=UPI001F322824|nr:ribulose-phosphate 3-epimerase [Oryzibacter oryziterrae]